MKNYFFTCLLVCMASISMAEVCPTNYYNAVYGKKDAALKTAISGVIRPHTAITYGSGSCTNKTWGVFYYADQDEDGYCMDMYCDDWVKFGNCGQAVAGCNIEHSFAKSWWGGDSNDAYKDCYHLNPSNEAANSSRSSYPLGVPTMNIKESGTGSLKVGKATYAGQTFWVFEPKDEYKGDFARAYFYMVTCYGEELTWVTNQSSIGSYYAMRDADDANAYLEFQDWEIEVLLKWHRQDSVSEKELNRMDAVSNFQHNRNPYIDHPEWVEYIWGNKKGQVLTNSQTVAVSGVSISTTSHTMNVGSTVQLTETIVPSNATNKNVTWTSDDSQIASVSTEGLVQGISAGTTTIKVTTEDGSYTANCTITIEEVDEAYTIAEAKSAYDQGTIVTDDSIRVKGYITNITIKPSNFSKYHSAIIWLSDSNGTSKDFELYNCQGMNGVQFSTFDPYQASGTSNVSANSVTDASGNVFSIGSKIEAYGKIHKFNSTYELQQNCYITKKFETPAVAVTGITLNRTTATVPKQKTITLNATVSPINATVKTVTWSSSNKSVATVSGGVVTCIKAGETTITATTEDGGYKASCVVTVTNDVIDVYTIAQAKDWYDKGGLSDDDEIQIKGYITNITIKPDNFSKFHSAIIWISDSQGTSKDFELYNCLGMNGVQFSTFEPYQASGTTNVSADSVTDASGNVFIIGDLIEAKGKIHKFNSTYELQQNCYITNKTEAQKINVRVKLPTSWDSAAIYSWRGTYTQVAAMTCYRTTTDYKWWKGTIASDANGFKFKNKVDKDTWTYQTADIAVPEDVTCYELGTYSDVYSVNVADCDYYISLQPANANHGVVFGGGIYKVNTQVVIGASAFDGYQFDYWSDGNRASARRIEGTEDIQLTAYFRTDKTDTVFVHDTTYVNMIEVNSMNPTMGTAILQAAAMPEAGYQFLQWSDFNTENPREIEVMDKPQSFTAFFTEIGPATINRVQTSEEGKAIKRIVNDHLIIEHNGKAYDARGRNL